MDAGLPWSQLGYSNHTSQWHRELSLSSFPEQFWRGAQFLFLRGQQEGRAPHSAPHLGKEENASPIASPQILATPTFPASQCVGSSLADMAGDKPLQSNGLLFSSCQGCGQQGQTRNEHQVHPLSVINNTSAGFWGLLNPHSAAPLFLGGGQPFNFAGSIARNVSSF